MGSLPHFPLIERHVDRVAHLKQLFRPLDKIDMGVNNGQRYDFTGQGSQATLLIVGGAASIVLVALLAILAYRRKTRLNW